MRCRYRIECCSPVYDCHGEKSLMNVRSRGAVAVTLVRPSRFAPITVTDTGVPLSKLTEWPASFRDTLRGTTARGKVSTMVEGPAFLHSLFENSSDGIAQLGPDGNVLWVNQALCSMLGYAQQDLVGARFSELVAAENANRTAVHRSLLGRRARRRLHTRLVDRNGNSRWVAITRLSSTIGSSPVCTASVQDVTELEL